MKLRLSVLSLIVILLLALGSVGVACGGGETLSLEEYFERVEEIDDDAEERSDEIGEQLEEELDEASDDEEEVDALRDSYDELASAISDMRGDLKRLNPPAEAKDSHNDYVDATSDGLELLREFVDQFGDVESQSEAEDLFEDEFEDDFDDMSERLDDACVELQDIADDNDIDADLECEGGGEA